MCVFVGVCVCVCVCTNACTFRMFVYVHVCWCKRNFLCALRSSSDILLFCYLWMKCIQQLFILWTCYIDLRLCGDNRANLSYACMRACVQIKEQILKISGGVAFVEICHVTHMNESYQISHVTHTNESCCAPKCVKSCTRTNHTTHTNTSCHTHEYVMSHTRMRHVTHTNVSCHARERIMSQSRMRHVKHYVRRQNEKFSILCLTKILRVPGDVCAL